MGQYHGKDPWYLEYHGVEIVHAFSSSYLHMYVELFHKTRIYFLKLHLYHSFVQYFCHICTNLNTHPANIFI